MPAVSPGVTEPEDVRDTGHPHDPALHWREWAAA
jgi:hypothetical protein